VTHAIAYVHEFLESRTSTRYPYAAARSSQLRPSPDNKPLESRYTNKPASCGYRSAECARRLARLSSVGPRVLQQRVDQSHGQGCFRSWQVSCVNQLFVLMPFKKDPPHGLAWNRPLPPKRYAHCTRLIMKWLSALTMMSAGSTSCRTARRVDLHRRRRLHRRRGRRRRTVYAGPLRAPGSAARRRSKEILRGAQGMNPRRRTTDRERAADRTLQASCGQHFPLV